MLTDVFTHRFFVQRIDDGHALAVLEPRDDGRVEAEAMVALAQRLSRMAIESAVRNGCSVNCEAAQSQFTHLGAPQGRVSAAALVDRRLIGDVHDDLRRTGSAHARVNVALVDDAGEALALGSFEFDLARA